MAPPFRRSSRRSSAAAAAAKTDVVEPVSKTTMSASASASTSSTSSNEYETVVKCKKVEDSVNSWEAIRRDLTSPARPSRKAKDDATVAMSLISIESLRADGFYNKKNKKALVPKKEQESASVNLSEEEEEEDEEEEEEEEEEEPVLTDASSSEDTIQEEEEERNPRVRPQRGGTTAKKRKRSTRSTTSLTEEEQTTETANTTSKEGNTKNYSHVEESSSSVNNTEAPVVVLVKKKKGVRVHSIDRTRKSKRSAQPSSSTTNGKDRMDDEEKEQKNGEEEKEQEKKNQQEIDDSSTELQEEMMPPPSKRPKVTPETADKKSHPNDVCQLVTNREIVVKSEMATNQEEEPAKQSTEGEAGEAGEAAEAEEEEEKKDDTSSLDNLPPAPPQGPEPFEVVQDTNPYYIEEEAHMYHNPPLPSEKTLGVPPNKLEKIPPPPPLPELPNTGSCHWSFDEESRVLLATFSDNRQNHPSSDHHHSFLVMDPIDEKFFLEMLERNDITVVSEGLLNKPKMDPEKWSLNYLHGVLGTEYFHKFRRFDTPIQDHQNSNGGAKKQLSCQEIDGLYSMRMVDYVEYLVRRRKFLYQDHNDDHNDNDDDKEEETNKNRNSVDPNFTFVNHLGEEHTIHVGTSAIYMIDFDMHKLTPLLWSNFMESFRYPQVLPGGDHCMMNSVTPNARPFMGPNMYITPPAAFTHFHQDGHGTVDSGHLCIKGYNEVIMLRRLTERHKKHALWILTGNAKDRENPRPTYFDGLYEVPHGDQLGEKPGWPTKDKIQECKNMGYCPTVCIVKPGQLIHLNKGRLHAFRKMSTATLPDQDCHFELREQIKAEKNFKGEELCISVAWDWMFRGVTAEGIHREVCSVLEATILNRKHGKQSLAIPELSLLQMARVFPPNDGVKIPAEVDKLIDYEDDGDDDDKSEEKPKPYRTSRIDVCRGILPALQHVVGQHLSVLESATDAKSQSRERGARVTIAKRPNTHESPQHFPVDPYGNNDFICKLCSKELSNTYFHCDGCERLLSKDFNICQECHAEKKFLMKVQMHPLNGKRHSTINHTGDMRFDRRSRCICKNGPVCKYCDWCSGCSCRCHTWFTLQARFFSKEGEEALLERVENAVPSDQHLDKAGLHKDRFVMAATNYEF